MSLARILRLRAKAPEVVEPDPPCFLDEGVVHANPEVLHALMRMILAKPRPRNLLNHPGGSVLLNLRVR